MSSEPCRGEIATARMENEMERRPQSSETGFDIADTINLPDGTELTCYRARNCCLTGFPKSNFGIRTTPNKSCNLIKLASRSADGRRNCVSESDGRRPLVFSANDAMLAWRRPATRSELVLLCSRCRRNRLLQVCVERLRQSDVRRPVPQQLHQ